jgi:anti-sigma-K factor RskA
VSGASNGNDHASWEGNAAAYALGALEQRELEAFERHLADCARCQRELAAMRVVVDRLSTATPQLTAPAAVKQRVLEAVRAETAAPVAGLASRRRPLISRRRLPAVLVASATALVALVVLIGALSLSGGSSARTYAGVVNAPGATASVRVSGEQARLVFARLPTLPTRLIYEMWLKRGTSSPVPAGALFASTSGAVPVPGGVRGIQAVLVTAEPRPSGSHKPTRAPLIVVRLA